MSTSPTTKKHEQPSLIAPPAEAIEKPTQPSAAVQAAAAEKQVKQEGIAEMAIYIPLNKIVPSPTNPRKTFDQDYLNELAVTIASDRVHQAIVVREWTAKPSDMQRVLDIGAQIGTSVEPDFNPGDNIFQIVMGECRWRASMLAGKETIPAVVRNLSNADMLKIQLIENLQRKDLDPLDEAEGYAALMQKAEANGSGMSEGDIAKSIGKSVQYVSARVKLCALSEPAKRILREKYISPGHAVLIARIGDDAGQEQALRAVFGVGAMGDLFGVVRRTVEHDVSAAFMSEKALRQWIADNIRCDLKKAPWNKADADLLPEAGACDGCQFRSLTNQALFSEVTPKGEDRCLKPTCFAQKRAAHIKHEESTARDMGSPLQRISVQEAVAPALPNTTILKAGQWVPARRGECQATVRGILINGEEEGSTPFVCTDAKCKVHKHPPVVVPFETAHCGGAEARRTAGDLTAKDAEGREEISVGAQSGSVTVTMTGRELQGGTRLHGGAMMTEAAYEQAAGRQTRSPVDDREERMAAARHKAEAAVNELIVHRVLAAEAATIKKPDEGFLRPIAEFFLQNHYFDADRVIAGLGLDPDQLYESDPIEKIKGKGSLAELSRLVWLLMVPDTIDHESDQIKTWAKRNKLDLGKVRKELTARIEKACFYCGCTELTPCEGGCDRSATNGKLNFCNGLECGKKFLKEHGAALDTLRTGEFDQNREQLRLALGTYAGADKRWQRLSASGATDEQLIKEIGDALGISGGRGGPDGVSVAYRGGKDPAVFFNTMSTHGKPSLHGKALIAAVRDLYKIGSEPQIPQTPVNHKPLTTEATEKHGGKAGNLTAKDAKVAKGKEKPKPATVKKAAPASKVKAKAKGQGLKAKSQAKPKGKRKA